MKKFIEKLKIGDKVITVKGCRMAAPSSGIITGWSKWKDYDAAQVKKDNGKTKQFLIQNLRKI